MNAIKKFLISLKEPNVFFTFLNYVVKIFLNPIIVFFVPLFLNETMQGYWYTFGSIAALTTFADLGFTTIMTQYVAHECAFLVFNKDSNKFDGEEKKIGRLASLFQFVIRWGSMILLLAAVIIFIVGIIMFSNNAEGVKWEGAWLVYVIGTIINFGTQIELSFFEGCNQFAITQKVRTVAGTVHCILTIVLLACNGNLYALGIPLIIKAVTVIVLLNRKFGNVLKQLSHTVLVTKISWTKEFLPLLGQYAISWISGYFITQIYSPLSFARYGATAAGKVGYCLSIVQAIYSVANVWMVLATPKLNMLEERKDWHGMDRNLKQNLSYAVLTYGIGIAALFTIGRSPLLKNIIWTRMLSTHTVIILCFAYLGAMVINALAVYLRSHKKEPFMLLSVVSGVISCSFTTIITYKAGVEFIFCGLLLDYFLIVPLGIYIWKKCKKEWYK